MNRSKCVDFMFDIVRLSDDGFRAIALHCSDRLLAKLLGLSKSLHKRFADEFKQQRRRAVNAVFANLLAMKDDQRFNTNSWRVKGMDIRFCLYYQHTVSNFASDWLSERVVKYADYICINETVMVKYGREPKFPVTNRILLYPCSMTVWSAYDTPESDDDNAPFMERTLKENEEELVLRMFYDLIQQTGICCRRGDYAQRTLPAEARPVDSISTCEQMA